MPRKKLIITADYPYHVTNRSNNKEFFYLEKQELWEIFMRCLNELRIQFKCEIHSFVLMSNHYHLIISTPEGNIGEAMKYLHREVARKANQSANRVNHFFGSRYKWSVIYNENYYWNAVKYIFRNPIRAGICSLVSDYKYSSLNKKSIFFEWKMIDFFNHSKDEIEIDLDWLNEPFLKETEVAIGKALRRREFQLTRDKNGLMLNLEAAHYKKGTVT